MNQSFAPIATVLIFAALNEAFIEYICGNVKQIRGYIPLISLISGIMLALVYQINFFSQVLGIQSNAPFIDTLLSGFIISRGSNFLNDFVQKFLGSK